MFYKYANMLALLFSDKDQNYQALLVVLPIIKKINLNRKEAEESSLFVRQSIHYILKTTKNVINVIYA